MFCQLGLHVVVCNTCAPARSGIVKKRVAGGVGVRGTPERKPGNAAGLRNSRNNLYQKTPMVSGGFRSGLLLQMGHRLNNLWQQLVLPARDETRSQNLVFKTLLPLRNCQLSMYRCQLNWSVSFPPKVKHPINISKSNTRIDFPRHHKS